MVFHSFIYFLDNGITVMLRNWRLSGRTDRSALAPSAWAEWPMAQPATPLIPPLSLTRGPESQLLFFLHTGNTDIACSYESTYAMLPVPTPLPSPHRLPAAYLDGPPPHASLPVPTPRLRAAILVAPRGHPLRPHQDRRFLSAPVCGQAARREGCRWPGPS
jgi:hypothetical protein